MIYEVSTNQRGIDFAATGAQEILQNVWMILSTFQYSCPLARDFAWSPEELDAALPVTQARTSARLIAAIRQYEPRAEVVEITYKVDPINGNLNPVVKVRIGDGAF